MKVVDIIQRVRDLLQDVAAIRWTNTSLLDTYNEALLAVVQNRPDVNSQLLPFTCQPQAVQSLPPGTYRLLDIVDNPSTGRTVIATTRSSSLDSLLPNWTTATGTRMSNSTSTIRKARPCFMCTRCPRQIIHLTCWLARHRHG